MRGYVRGGVTGEPYAQVDNPDPFAAPDLAVTGLPDPGAADLARAARPPGGAGALVRDPSSAGWTPQPAVLVLVWLNAGWPGLATGGGNAAAGLLVLRLAWPGGSPGWSPARSGTGGGGGSTGAAGRRS